METEQRISRALTYWRGVLEGISTGLHIEEPAVFLKAAHYSPELAIQLLKDTPMGQSIGQLLEALVRDFISTLE